MTKRRKLYEEKRRDRLNRPGRWVKEPVGLTEYQKELLFGKDEARFELRFPTIPEDKKIDTSWLDRKRKEFLETIRQKIADNYNKNNK